MGVSRFRTKAQRGERDVMKTRMHAGDPPPKFFEELFADLNTIATDTLHRIHKLYALMPD